MTRHGGSLVLVLLGAVLLVASLFQGDGNAAYAFGLLIFGSGLVTLGVVLPRLRNAEVGPATGFKLTLDEEREVSTGLAESDDVALVEVDQVVAATRLVLASETLGRLLAPEEGPLADAWFHLYLFDDRRSCCCPRSRAGPVPVRDGSRASAPSVSRGSRGSTCWSGARRCRTTPTASHPSSSTEPATWLW